MFSEKHPTHSRLDILELLGVGFFAERIFLGIMLVKDLFKNRK